MLIIANWKAYVEDSGKAKKLVALANRLARASEHRIILSPPAPFMSMFALARTSPISFAAQDVSATSGGATTGEVTALMSASAGATYTIIGHSERRAAGDTNVLVAEKLTHALAHNLIPILCVGERERDSEGRYLNFIREELTTALAPLTPKERAKVIIAYEPLWAIGKTAAQAITSTELIEMTLYIRKVLTEFLPGKNASRALILYGGSVGPDNIRELAGATHIDGFLIGHASVEETTFSELVKRLS